VFAQHRHHFDQQLQLLVLHQVLLLDLIPRLFESRLHHLQQFFQRRTRFVEHIVEVGDAYHSDLLQIDDVGSEEIETLFGHLVVVFVHVANHFLPDIQRVLQISAQGADCCVPCLVFRYFTVAEEFLGHLLPRGFVPVYAVHKGRDPDAASDVGADPEHHAVSAHDAAFSAAAPSTVAAGVLTVEDVAGDFVVAIDQHQKRHGRGLAHDDGSHAAQCRHDQRVFLRPVEFKLLSSMIGHPAFHMQIVLNRDRQT